MTHTALPAFACTHGPRDAKVVLLGEAWGEQEEKLMRPFVGMSGLELIKMLAQSGLGPGLPVSWSEKRFISLQDMMAWWQSTGFLATNVLALRPLDNKLENVSLPKALLPEGYNLPHISQGKYLDPQYLGELTRLRQELEAHPRNLIIALGATASWFLLRTAAIGSIRGTIHQSPWGKVLPTYHPAAVLRQWGYRVICVADFMKAQREAQFPETRRLPRSILINPTFEELWNWTQAFYGCPERGVDTETSNRQITTVGFAATPQDALVIPIWDRTKPGLAYWPTSELELKVWRRIEWFLRSPGKNIFQNGLYDIQYFWRHGLRIMIDEDTMLMHHSLWPELPKGLGFIASIQVDEVAWKLMRKDREELKRDE